MEPVERFDPEGSKDLRGVETGEITGAPEIGAGQRVTGAEFALCRLRNRTERRSPGSNGFGGFSAWKRRGRPGTLTSQWWRKRRCERAKGRFEFPVPARCSSPSRAVDRIDPAQAEKRRRRAGEQIDRSIWPQIERRACRRFAQSCREPWTFFLAVFAVASGPAFADALNFSPALEGEDFFPVPASRRNSAGNIRSASVLRRSQSSRRSRSRRIEGLPRPGIQIHPVASGAAGKQSSHQTKSGPMKRFLQSMQRRVDKTQLEPARSEELRGRGGRREPASAFGTFEH